MKYSHDTLQQLALEAEREVTPQLDKIEEIALANQQKVLNAFRHHAVAEYHLKSTSGYGYNDEGREVLEKVYAAIFGTEAALVRGQIASGTHAISLCLLGILRPGDRLLSLSGAPYDTLQKVIGLTGEARGTLIDQGITYEQVDLLESGEPDWEGIRNALRAPATMVMLQRSRGYSPRASLDIKTTRDIIAFVKQKQPGTVVFVDNCYGEFVEAAEPPAAGADLIAGSLIKNPGGGLAPAGGYVAGKSELVEMAASRLTAPGIGGEVGASLGWQRMFYQGIFIAPSVVSQALKGAIFAARLFEKLDFHVFPSSTCHRTDIVQGIILGAPERLVSFCQAVQKASPVDSHFLPEPWEMPGYTDPVIMAAGTFVQGASLELTADGPVRPPYAAYLQGGLTFHHAKIAVVEAAREVLKES